MALVGNAMALRSCLSLQNNARKLECFLTKGLSVPSWIIQCRFAGTRPRPSDDLKLQRRIRPNIQLTPDSIYKRPGNMLSAYRSTDGKPFFPGKNRNIRLSQGTIVRAGMTVCMQKKLEFHPGLHVGLGRKLSLFCYEDGVVYITWEKINCNWDNWIAREYYIDEKDDDIYMPHYHVIPQPQLKNFKLVSQV